MPKKQILTNSDIENDIKNILKRPANLSNAEYRKSLTPLLVIDGLVIVGMLAFQAHYKLVLLVAIIIIAAYLTVDRFRKKKSIKNVSIEDYEIKNEAISYIKEEVYISNHRSRINRYTSVYIMHFEDGKTYNIPKNNYVWSKECPMSDRTLYEMTHRGDIFTVVTKKDTGEIVMTYPTDYFEYKN